jgi:hypothetical protein
MSSGVYVNSAVQYYIVFSLQLSQTMGLVYAGVYSKHVQVIRCDIRPGSVKKSRDVENGTISFFFK